MKLLGILGLESGELIFLPFKGRTPSLSTDSIGRIVDIPTPEEVAISKEVVKDYSVEGLLKKNENTKNI